MEMPEGGHHRKPIVSLTYDGTQACHAETVLPQLEKTNLRGTFYADPLPLLEDVQFWRSAVSQGHEVGNGCLIGSVDELGLLEAWTPEMVADDIDETDRLIRELFPTQAVFSFGYPWITGGAYGMGHLRKIVEERHTVCRSAEQGTNALHQPDTAFLRCHTLDGSSRAEMIELVRSGTRRGEWVVLAFDGVGSGEPAVDAIEHQALCEWLAEAGDIFEVLPVREAASRLQDGTRPALRLL